LARGEWRVSAAAVGAHGNVQPAGVAGEHAGPEVQRDGEEAVAHRHGVGGERRADLPAARDGIVELELEVVTAVGRLASLGQFALVREGRAEWGRVADESRQGQSADQVESGWEWCHGFENVEG
jgi:hypothetical protein